MLDINTKNKLKQLVFRHKEKLRKELLRMSKVEKSHMQSGDGKSSSSNHPADNPRQPNVNLAIIENIQKQMRKCDDAIDRIEDGEYGYCKDCGDAIPFGRLEKIPFADRCVDCKTQAEKNDRSPNSYNTRMSRPTAVLI